MIDEFDLGMLLFLHYYYQQLVYTYVFHIDPAARISLAPYSTQNAIDPHSQKAHKTHVLSYLTCHYFCKISKYHTSNSYFPDGHEVIKTACGNLFTLTLPLDWDVDIFLILCTHYATLEKHIHL